MLGEITLPEDARALLREKFGVDSPSDLPYETRKSLLQLITRPLWLKGDLDFQRHEGQRQIRHVIRTATGRKVVVLCSRRYGKTHELLAGAVEMCLSRPNARVLFLAPTKQNAREIATDVMGAVLAWCPDDLKPEYYAQTHEFHFKNGSVIRLRGVNGETADNLRGGSADLVICDEFGFWDEAENVVQRVALPMTITTGGRIIMATTPPEDPAHYSARAWKEAQESHAGIRFTLLDAPHISDDVKAEYLREAGEDPARIPDILAGKCDPETTTALREYWARFVTDSSRAIIGEMSRHKTLITQPYLIPAFFDRYVALDPGFVDKTGALYGFSDFFNSRLVIQDESLLSKAATPDIAAEVKRKEAELWPGYVPFRRVSDIDLRLIADLRALHGLEFHKAQKQDLKGGVNLVRALIRSNQLVIDPRCVNLLTQMEMGTWNKKGTEFTNSGDGSELGHLDLLAALVYLVRAWWTERHHNPYPKNWRDVGFPGGPPAGSWISAKSRPSSDPRTNLLAAKTPLARNLLAARKKSAAR